MIDAQQNRTNLITLPKITHSNCGLHVLKQTEVQAITTIRSG